MNKQKELTRTNGIYTIDSGAVYSTNVYAIIDKNKQATATATLTTLIQRLQQEPITTDDQAKIITPPQKNTPAQQARTNYLTDLAEYLTSITGNPQDEDTNSTNQSIAPPVTNRRPRISYAAAAASAQATNDKESPNPPSTSHPTNSEKTQASSSDKTSPHTSEISSITASTTKALESMEQKLQKIESREGTAKIRMDAITKELRQTQKITTKALDKMAGMQDEFLHLTQNMEKQLDIIQRSFTSFRQFQQDQMDERFDELKDQIITLLAETTTTTKKTNSTKRNRKASCTSHDMVTNPKSPTQSPLQKRLQTLSANSNNDQPNNPTSPTKHKRSTSTNRFHQLSDPSDDSEESDADEPPFLPPIEEDEDMKSTESGGQSE